MSSTVTESTAPVSVTDLGPSGLKYRSLKAARDAYSCEDDNARQQLSREAHSLLSKPEPGSPLLPPTSTWSPWAADAEAGHNEELAYRGQTLLLRGGVDGIIMSLFILSLGDAAGWTLMRTLTLNAVLLGCWAIYSAGREALEVLTYRAHYARERSREAWELDNFPEGEVEEMVQLYCKRGLPEHAARSVISTMAAHSSEFFVDVMMLVRAPARLEQPGATETTPNAPIPRTFGNPLPPPPHPQSHGFSCSACMH